MAGESTTAARRGLRYEEPTPELDEIARRVIGTSMEVHTTLGPGFQESVYESALCIELGIRDIEFSRQHEVSVDYKGHEVGSGRMDVLVEGSLVVEIKTVTELQSVHVAQVMSYLKASGCKLGLLLNFSVKSMKQGVRRVVLS